VSVSVIETVGFHWRSLRTQFLDLILPRRCIGCRRMGAWLCAECLDQAPRLGPPFCARCGSTTDPDGRCRRCRTPPLKIECIRSVVYSEGVLREAVHRFKYDGLTALAEPLGGLMAAHWAQYPIPADVVVPVPLHAARLRERGYNQAALLASEMARRVGLPVDGETLHRQRATAPQVELGARQRRENVRDAFRCSGTALAGKHVLLVDDVCTTGSTLEACALALYEGGARAVRALTLACARYGKPD
jgi:ComF family protein